ncbi:MAG TPA: GNAT family N-acetyltransferase [Mucilaginibacter sp.]|jgi:RimJ/RimL family protein N-acetyltransferase
MPFPYHRYGLTFRLVEESDAPFILGLRTDPKLGRHLSFTNNDLDQQALWIKNYKEREAQGAEYYILFEEEKLGRAGVVRLYNINGDFFTSGSWLIRPGCDELIALKSDLFVLQFAFEELKMQQCFIDTRKDNKKVINYHKRFFTKINEDEENLYFVMGIDGYQRKSQFLKSILEL